MFVGQSAGDVRFSANAHASPLRPSELDFESLFIQVDGVEHVIGGSGNDLLFIDETEAAKDNTFSAGLGDDRVEYQNFYGVAESAAEPSVTIKVNSLGTGSHEVEMTGGRVGSIVATDSLIDVEIITLLQSSNTATSSRNDDTIDVSAMTGSVIVDYTTGEIRDGNGVVHLTIENISEIEQVVAYGTNTLAAEYAPDQNQSQVELGIVGIDTVDYSAAIFLAG